MKSAFLMKTSVLLLSILFFALPSSVVAQTGDVVVTSNASWAAGTYQLNSLTVQNGATLTVAGGSTLTVSGAVVVTGNSNIVLQGANTSAQVNGAWAGTGVTMNAATVEVDAGSSINADSQGYGVSAGPGGAPIENGMGGTYGGVGAYNTAAIYGSSTIPTDLGSGGGCASNGCGYAGNGGGAIQLNVSGTLTDNGIISANGGGSQNYSNAGGAGSGGSIYVTAGSLVGAGVFNANGGSGTSQGANAGGGGRVAVYYGTNSNFTGFATSTALGGSSINCANCSGTNGTVGFFDTSVANNNVNIYQQFTLPASSNVTYNNLTVQPGATLTVGGGSTITVTNKLEVGGTLMLQSSNTTAQVNGAWAGVGVTLNAANVQVDATGWIDADSQGYALNDGPGGAPSQSGVGGTYGGVGAFNTAAIYGSATTPTDLGSGGGCGSNGCGYAGNGGGAIQLNVSGTLTDNGIITANGGNSANYSNAGGAGSGGSVYIHTISFAGSGSIAANGGSGTTNGANAGGGGRVAVYFATNSNFNLALVTANGGIGGQGTGTTGAVGTVYTLDTVGANTNLTVSEDLVFPANSKLNFASITVNNQGSLTLGSGTTVAVGSITVSNGGTLTIGGGSTVTVADALTLTGGSTIITQAINTSAEVSGAWAGAGVTISAGSVQVDATSTISADGQGYGAGSGPGTTTNWAGGSYGGAGGYSSGNSAGATYGSYLAPTDLGSGGAVGCCNSGYGNSGGGAIRLNATGTLALDGLITADGAAGTEYGGVSDTVASSGGGMGGSGGSIYITAATISGSGSMAATGGIGGPTGGVGGGGGRIAVLYTTNSGFDLTKITASGGSATNKGSSGTVYLYGGDGNLTLTQNLVVPGGQVLTYDKITLSNGATLTFGAATTLSSQSITVSGGSLLTIGGGSTVNTSGALTVSGNSNIVLQGANTSAQVNSAWAGAGVTINAASVQVDAGSAINADGQGYVTGAGPGFGTGNNNNIGGSYGGVGSGNTSDSIYGSTIAPFDLGSGGFAIPWQWNSGLGASGGGAIRLNITGSLTLNGTISANGAAGIGGGGSGSGGSIYVTAGSLAGAGTFNANGGAGSYGGGGGRMAIYYAANNSFTGFTASTASGGAGSSKTGSNGTSAFFDTSVTNYNLNIYQNFTMSAGSTPIYNGITVQNSGLLTVGGGATVSATGAVVVTGNSTIVLLGANSSSQVYGSWVGSGVTIDAASVQVDAGSTINADGQGYGAGAGPGFGTGNGNNIGGSYGGVGSGNTSSSTYGSSTAPVDLGSGGFAIPWQWNSGAGASGGGAVRLNVTGSLTLNGSISANGAAGSGGGGSGSGGSVYLIANSLAGTGTINVDGGAGSYGGGGGRVAVYYGSDSGFAQSQISAAGGQATNKAGNSGTIVFSNALESFWVSPTGSVLHGTETLQWYTDAGTTVDVIAAGPQIFTVAKSASSSSAVTWDTTTAPDGLYELRLLVHEQNGSTVLVPKTVAVNNSVTWHTGTLATSQEWSASQVHALDGIVVVPSGITLTIDPGTVVKALPGAEILVEAGGILNALGGNTAPVIFTTFDDSSNGGNTDFNAGVSLPTAGEWQGIVVMANGQLSTNANTEILYTKATLSGTLGSSESLLGTQVYEISGTLVVPSGAVLSIQPGAILKFDSGAGIDVQPGGQLVANGTLAQPIYFTSINDDSVGGDTNGNGSATLPAPGDWGSISINGTGTTAAFDHVHILYGGGPPTATNQLGTIQTGSNAVVTISNSILAKSFWTGLWTGYSGGGDTVTVTDTIFYLNEERAINAFSGSTVHVVNDTFDGNSTGVMAHGGNVDISNSIITNSNSSTWGGVIQCCGGSFTALQNNDVWTSVAGVANYTGITDPTGSNGNISADPVFVNEAQNDFRLNYGSPAIDAANGTVANYPLTDAMGDARYNDPLVTKKTGTADANGNYPDMGALEFVQSAPSNIDFTVSAVDGPSSAMVDGQAQVNWTITNIGTGTAYGPWHDAVYLVHDPDTNPVEVYAGQFLEGAGVVLGPGATYSGTATVVVPGTVVGNHRWEVKTNVLGEIFEGQNTANNSGQSLDLVAVDLPTLTVGGTSQGGSFSAVGQSWWYKILPGTSQSVHLNLALSANSSQTSAGSVQLFIGQGYVPTPQQYDFEQVEWNSPTASAVIANASSQTYYVTVYAQALTATPVAYTLTVSPVKFSLTSVTPGTAVSNNGSATLTFVGGGFTSASTFQLVANGGSSLGSISSSSVFVADSTHADVTFSMTNMPVGSYTAQVTEGGSTVSLTNALTVTAASTATASQLVQVDLETPQEFRSGFPATVTLNYTNISGADVPAPLIWLTATGATLAEIPPECASCSTNFTQQYESTFTSGLVLGIDQQGPAGVLPAGAHGSIQFQAMPTGDPVTFTVQHLDAATPDILIGYIAEEEEEGSGCGVLAGVSRVKSNSFAHAEVGGGVLPCEPVIVDVPAGSFKDAAAFCSAFQPPFASTAGFSRTCMQLLNGAGYKSSGLDLLDGVGVNNLLATDATALSQVGIYEHDFSHLLNFEYLKDGFGVFNQRYHQGAFGFGGSHAFDITAEIYNSAPVVHYPDGSARQFPTLDTANSNQYLGSTGDKGVLSIATDGSWLLTESSGVVYHFMVDPVTNTTNRHLLDYNQDLNGNRITLAYTNDLVTGASDNFGNTITFAYDTLGHITQSTDPVGRITTYTYDIKNDSLNSTFLTSITNMSGTTSLSWNEGEASGVGYFSDSCVATNCEPAIGVNTITYPDGTHTYFTYDSLGRIASTYLDGNIGMLTFSYNATGAVTTTDAAGNVAKSMPNAYGSPVQYTDPLGSVTQFSYDPENKLAGVHEPLGTNSFYSYDALGNPASMIDPLGNQENQSYMAYNSLQSFTDAAGNATSFAYDSRNNQTATTYPDGNAEQYTYDSHGNITGWTNRRGHTINYAYNAKNLTTSKTYASGAQVSYTYDNHNNLSSVTASNGITNFTYDTADRLTGVSYPNGKSIQYAYNSGSQRTSMADSTGFKVNYSYDAAGRLSQLTNGSGASIVAYTYDAMGRLTKKLMGNGTYTTFAYDADDNLLHLINYSSGGAVLSKFDYTYDALGNQIAMNAPNGAWTFGYDADSQIVSFTMLGGGDQFTYDADGNILSTSTANYNLNNLNEVTAVGATAYQYDADGNLISGGGWTYSYDDDNRLIGMVDATDTWTYQYDGLGNRVAATHNGSVTQYLNDPSGLGYVEAEFNGSGQLVSHYTFGLDLTSSIPAGGTAAYYNFDAAGNTAQMTNATGSVVNSYTYLPFGEKTTSITGVSNPFTYVGEFGVMDEGSGLYFMRNRWYSPALGRFVQQDPIGLAGGTNLYRYSTNNPLISMDPNGTCPGDQDRTFVDDISDFGSSTSGRALNVGSGLIGLIPGGKMALVGHVAGQIGMVPTEGSLVTNGAHRDWVGVIHDGGMLAANMSSFIPHPAFKWLGALSGTIDEGSQVLFNWGAHKYYGGEDNIPANIHQRPCGGTPPNTPPPVPPIPPYNPGDPLFHKQPKDPTNIPSGSPKDPNGKLTSGFGDQGYIPAGTPISYTIYFENESSATAPAEIVTVSDPLDANLDWSTVQLDQIEFNNVTINVPNGGQSYTGQVNVSTDPNPVKVTASLNASTGVLSWKMQSVDPVTGGLPANPLAGFLPPNNSSNEGTGYVTFSVMPKASLADGTAISNTASIVFDVNAAIATNTVTNTIDTTAPISAVDALPATTTSTSIPVSWSGSDPSGSGIAGFNIFVSINGGAYSVWLPATTLTSATYTGLVNNSYSFYSMATDNVGHQQQAAGQVQTTTISATALATPKMTVTPNPSSITTAQALTVTVAVSGGSGNPTPTGTVTLSGGGFTSTAATLSSGSATIAIPANSLKSGIDTLTVTYGGDSNYASANGTASVTVTALPLTPTVTVTPAATTQDSGSTLSVATAVTGAGVTPTGTVTLSSGGYTSAAATLSSGSYTFTIPANSLSAGTDTLTVSYSGDSNYIAGTGTASVTVTESVFSLAATTPAAVASGSPATSTVTVNTATGYAGTVTLTCALTTSPTGAKDLPTCSGGSSTVTLSSGTTTGTATVTVTTTGSGSAMMRPAAGGAWTGGAVLAFLVFLGIPARRRGLRSMLGVLLLMTVLGGLAACGGGSGSGKSGTTAGSYTFTVTGTGSPSVTPAPTTTFTLTIN